LNDLYTNLAEVSNIRYTNSVSSRGERPGPVEGGFGFDYGAVARIMDYSERQRMRQMN
jgi:hypothetical protein